MTSAETAPLSPSIMLRRRRNLVAERLRYCAAALHSLQCGFHAIVARGFRVEETSLPVPYTAYRMSSAASQYMIQLEMAL